MTSFALVEVGVISLKKNSTQPFSLPSAFVPLDTVDDGANIKVKSKVNQRFLLNPFQVISPFSYLRLGISSSHRYV